MLCFSFTCIELVFFRFDRNQPFVFDTDWNKLWFNLVLLFRFLAVSILHRRRIIFLWKTKSFFRPHLYCRKFKGLFDQMYKQKVCNYTHKIGEEKLYYVQHNANHILLHFDWPCSTGIINFLLTLLRYKWSACCGQNISRWFDRIHILEGDFFAQFQNWCRGILLSFYSYQLSWAAEHFLEVRFEQVLEKCLYFSMKTRFRCS